MSPQDIYRLIAEDIEANGASDGTDVWERLNLVIDPTELRPKLAEDIEIRMFDQRWGDGYVMIANPRDLLHYRLAASDLELLGDDRRHADGEGDRDRALRGLR